MTDTKFPEAEMCDVWASWNGHPEEEVADWFKRCIEDFPAYYDKTMLEVWKEMFGQGVLAKQGTADIILWFEKWFGQFKEKPKRPCKMVGDKHATCSNCGTPTLVTEPWMYQTGLCHTCFDTKKEESQ